jgi:predicted acyltransferase
MEKANTRIVSLDQFRGYTVAGMFLVNFIGGFVVVPAIFKHHKTYCSYADTIMPQFFFAVGFAFRLAFLRHKEKLGTVGAYTKAIRRILGLLLIGMIIYQLDGGGWSWNELKDLGVLGVLSKIFHKRVFQTLVHIGLASLWVLPVIDKGAAVRIVFSTITAIAHTILSKWFYFDWARATGVIDGGQLGFMAWSISVIVGSLAYDEVIGHGPAGSIRKLTLWSIGLMVFGYAISCLTAVLSYSSQPQTAETIWVWLARPPFFPPAGLIDMWTMSQQTGSVSYQVFGAGFSLAVYVLFVWLSDVRGLEWGLLRTLGQNALAAYILHGIVSDCIHPLVPKDAPLWYIAIGFGVFFAITWWILKYLEKRGYYLRL